VDRALPVVLRLGVRGDSPRGRGTGARGRVRTGTTSRSRDFRTTSAFAAARGVRGLEHAFTLAPGPLAPGC